MDKLVYIDFPKDRLKITNIIKKEQALEEIKLHSPEGATNADCGSGAAAEHAAPSSEPASRWAPNLTRPSACPQPPSSPPPDGA
jgi:hypothetical protein